MPKRAARVAYWAEIIDRWKQSGLSKAEFCRRQSLSLASLKNWLYTRENREAVESFLSQRGAAAAVSEAARPRLVPVVVRPAVTQRLTQPEPAAPNPDSSLQVLLDSGRRVAVGRGFDPGTLRQLIAVLEAQP